MEWCAMDRLNSKFLRHLTALALLSLCGCGWWGGQSDRDVEDDDDALEEPIQASAVSSIPPSSPKPDIGPKVGDRFPLVKMVKQTLQQPSPQGWAVSRSVLEMLMTVSIEETHPTDNRRPEADVRAGQKRMLVKFDRIRLSQEIPGQPPTEYDSNAPTDPLPQAALPYHGLKDNSLGFWLSADNQVLELVGFEQFVSRCLQDVPPERRRQMSAAIAVPTAAEGIATFVDENIGLLPGTAVRAGDSWLRDRQVLQPVPLHLSQKQTLREIAADFADIDLQGTISAPVPRGTPNQPGPEVRVSIRGGQSQGRCRLDRRTGLPLDARVEQSLEMTVHMPNGTEFDQYKSTITSIQLLDGQALSAAGLREAGSASVAPRVAGGDAAGRNAIAR
jgi:hypothetical protein